VVFLVHDFQVSASPSAMQPLVVTAYTATSAVGAGRAALRTALRDRRSGLRRNDFIILQRESPESGEAKPPLLNCWIGRVDGVEEVVLPDALAHWDCRNNRLAWLGLQQDGFRDAVEAAKQRYGADRIALVIGTSTSSIGASEEAYARLDGDGHFPADLARSNIHTPHSLGGFLQDALGLEGPCVTVATACSSSAKVFGQAARLIDAGFADAAVVGGVDSLCGSVLYGFNSLQLISQRPCRPFDGARDGLSLGEASGYALLERNGDCTNGESMRFRGYGESSDAHHMSAPHPDGLGARLAMQGALARAGLAADAIGYINLHGTATPANDSVEAASISAVFPATTHASSTKGWSGHTLGAAGILEAVIALLALEHGELPGILHCETLDAACGPQIRIDNATRPIDYAMSNSFGFGGNNASLVFGRA
jgi:3-oxoacyl-[acyl-carrier-protein] synthase-1